MAAIQNNDFSILKLKDCIFVIKLGRGAWAVNVQWNRYAVVLFFFLNRWGFCPSDWAPDGNDLYLCFINNSGKILSSMPPSPKTSRFLGFFSK